MKYKYKLFVEEDTNDGDYINQTTELGVYDTEKKEDMDYIRTLLILLDNFKLDDGDKSVNIKKFKKQLKAYDIDYIKTLEWEETPESDEQLEDWLIDEISDNFEPWLDNCWNNHDFDYTMTKIPADVKEEFVSLNKL